MPAIVVITYNSAPVIDRCLDSCLAVAEAQVIVVDNASADGTVEQVRSRPSVRLIANDRNRGFAGAANQGIAAADSAHVLLLNPDAEIDGGLDALQAAVKQPGVGAAGGLLLGADGRPQSGFFVRGFPTAATLVFEALGLNRVWTSNPLNRRYRAAPPLDRVSEVDQPAGAFLMIRREAWSAIGGFDEEFYPIWFEDVDFCKRLKAAGWRILFVPAATARHQGGHSANALAWESRQVIWYGSMLAYAKKHLSSSGSRMLAAAITLGLLPRVLGQVWHERSGNALATYSKVVQLAMLSGRRVSARDRGGVSRLDRK